jgi:hypothetical protein
MRTRQRPWAIVLAIVAVLMLAYPSAAAVYEWLRPTRGPEAAFSAAAGIELTYLSLACLYFFTDDLKRYAFRLQLWAVFTAVLLNSAESYSKRAGVNITTGAAASRTFDPFLLGLSIGESIPLAGLAFGVSMILHHLVITDYAPGLMLSELLQTPPKLPWRARVRSTFDRAFRWLPRRPERRQDSQNDSRPSNLASDVVPAVSEPPRLPENVPFDIPWEPIDPGFDVVPADEPAEPEAPPHGDTVPPAALAALLNEYTTADPSRRKSIRRTLRERHGYYLRDEN